MSHLSMEQHIPTPSLPPPPLPQASSKTVLYTAKLHPNYAAYKCHVLKIIIAFLGTGTFLIFCWHPFLKSNIVFTLGFWVAGFVALYFWLKSIELAYLDTKKVYVTPTSVVREESSMLSSYWEKHVQLRNIVDVTLTQGCLQKRYGLHTIRIETPGQSTQPGIGDLVIDGFMNSKELCEFILDRANALQANNIGNEQARHSTFESKANADHILIGIHNTLLSIDQHLAAKEKISFS
eukprot:Phypoly_transcript_16099.p1 GENE.Phypoly_transcript_16099~~Phypoly_transcript_16099.p1  ORF type:complete len:236 (+),score=31.96 Phypoly_transcript_16099:129-836(+)